MKKLLIILGLTCVIVAPSVLYILDDRTFQDRKYLLANAYFQGDENKAPRLETAIDIWTGLAEVGHVPSQCFLGFIYKKGYQDILSKHDQTIEIDEDKAWGWAHKAAKGGCSLAMYQIGTWYQSYEDSKYADDAIYWLTPIAKNGYDNAQYNLNLVLFKKDPDQAKKWLVRAAKQGHDQAIKKLLEIDSIFKTPDFENPVYEHPASEASLDWMEYDPSFVSTLIMGV